MADFGLKLRSLRIGRGLTQEILAEKLGIKKPQISLWESQQHPPRPSTTHRLARALDVVPSALDDALLPTDPTGDNLGERLHRLRKQRGMTLRMFGEMLSVSHVTVSQWEKSICEPRLEKLKQISQLFGVSIDHLVFGADLPQT